MKKTKKDKKSKKKKQNTDSSEDDTSKGDEQVWVEVTSSSKTEETLNETSSNDEINKVIETPSSPAPVSAETIAANSKKAEDEWCTFLTDLPTVTSASLKEQKEDLNKKDDDRPSIDQMGQHVKELNPYWKDGGTGLPTTNTHVTPTVGTTGGSDRHPGSKPHGFNDSGASWLKKAYQRLVEKAETEGKPLEEVAAERWGSLARLEALIDLADEPSSNTEHTLSQHYRTKRSNRSRHQDYKDRSRQDDRSHSKDDRSHYNEDRSHKEYRSHNKEDRSRYKEDRSHNKADRSHKEDKTRPRDRESSAGHYPIERVPRDSSRDSGSRLSGRRLMKPSEEDVAIDNKEGRRSPLVSHRGWRRRDERNESPSWRKKEFITPRTEDVSSRAEDVISSDRTVDKKPDPSQDDDEISESNLPPQSGVTTQGGGGLVDSQSLELKSDVGVGPPVAPLKQPSEGSEVAPVKSVKILSREEMNRLAARLMKAEMLGNTELVSKLQKRLNDARATQESCEDIESKLTIFQNDPLPREQVKSREERVVVLTVTGKDGTEYPLEQGNSSDETPIANYPRKKRKAATHDSGGQRVKYFADDDRHNLQSLVNEERRTTAAQQNLQISKFLAMSGKSSMETLDDIFVSTSVKKMSGSVSEEQRRQQAMQESLDKTKTLEKCRFCFDNSEMMKHLVIAVGTKCYLALPRHESLVAGHCYIVPMHHVCAGNMLDEDVWAEMFKFKQCLVTMFRELEFDVVFMETALHRSHHMILKCVPLPLDEGSMAPMYYKKAIMESETEWSQNKKLVDLKNRDVRSAVPKGLPYFSVDFGMSSGYAHVVEDKDYFPSFFGEEIVGGLLDVEPRLWRHPPNQSFTEQNKKVLQFAEWFRPHDWTADVVT